MVELFKNSIDYLAIHFIYTWSKLTFQEQNIIVNLLDGSKKRIEIANSLGVTSGSLNRSLNRLLDFDFIEFVNGKYQIVDSILRYWLKTSFEKNGVYPFRSM